jgi:outer membrane protein OmpA-like peptidoglycan-associated protein
MSQAETSTDHCHRTGATTLPGASGRDRPGTWRAFLLLTAVAATTIPASTGLAATPNDSDGSPRPTQRAQPDPGRAADQPKGAEQTLTPAQRFERSPGVLGVSIRTLRKAMIKDYADESLGYLALDLEDLGLSPVSKGEGLRLNLAEKLQFASRKDTLPKSARPLLDGIARLLVENPGYLIQVVAHTDDRGDAGYNMRLSQRRAEAVKAYLMERGIEEVRLIASGRGETEPLAAVSGRRQTRSERARNRRVELLIEPMDLPAPVSAPIDVQQAQTRQERARSER